MKRRMIPFLLALALCLTACQTEPPQVSTDPTTEPTQTTVAPTETTVPPETTVPVETTVPPATEPSREYVPQDPDPLTYPSGHYQGTLAQFARMLYVHDNRPDAVLSELPEGFVYVGLSGDFSDFETAKYALSTWHIPNYSEFFASPDETDYLYYKTENGYRRMIRAALVENYWGGAELDPTVPEDYTFLFFESLLTSCSRSRSIYNLATGMSEYTNPRDVDISMLFYNGFEEERDIPLTADEEKFLSERNYELTGIKRLPVDRIHETLLRFFDIPYWDTNRVGKENMTYWEDTNCFYFWATGSRSEDVEVLSVDCDPDTDTYAVRYMSIYNAEFVITFRRAEGVLKILSNVKASE